MLPACQLFVLWGLVPFTTYSAVKVIQKFEELSHVRWSRTMCCVCAHSSERGSFLCKHDCALWIPPVTSLSGVKTGQTRKRAHLWRYRCSLLRPLLNPPLGRQQLIRRNSVRVHVVDSFHLGTFRVPILRYVDVCRPPLPSQAAERRAHQHRQNYQHHGAVAEPFLAARLLLYFCVCVCFE